MCLFLVQPKNNTMKKIYSIAACLFSIVSFAQQIVSFENSDGFYAGDIQGQGTWISTPTGDEPPNVLHQVICTDNATHGSNSLKIVKENTYGTQSIPIIGAFDNLPVLLSHNNFTVSFDMNMSQLQGSIFSFQALRSADEKYVVRLDFDNSGVVKVLKNFSGISSMESTSSSWSPNSWYRMKIVGTAADIKYYLNETLIYSGTAAEELNIDQLRFVHDNTEGVAYIDNIKIYNQAMLSVSNSTVNNNTVRVYPNPATDFIKISSSGKIKSIEVYDSVGKKVEATLKNDRVDVTSLNAGLYWVNIKTDGEKFSEKFIKK